MQSNLKTIFWTAITVSAMLVSVYFLFLREEEEYFTGEGCYIKTGLATQLLSAPEIFAPKITNLPRYKEYQVLEVKIIQHVGDKYMFLVEDEKLGIKGWVQPFGLEYSDPSCFK